MIVMKFGGTSMGSARAIRNVMRIVEDRLGERPVVVVSAVSGITNLLIEIARGAVRSHEEARQGIEKLRARHAEILADLALPADLVDEEIARLAELVRGIAAVRELTHRTLDYVMSFGEVLSARILARALSKAGRPSRDLTGGEAGILTDETYGQAGLLAESYEAIPKRLKRVKELCVVTGFIAKNRKGEISTLGRGGSDYSAAILGKALGAREIQIWTDVPGIMTTDPRIVPEARTVREVAFFEAAELAYFGAKVLHPKTIEPAVQANIPVRILNTFEPTDPGTVVLRKVPRRGRKMIAIALKRRVWLMNLTSTRMLDAHGYLARIFGVFDCHRVPVDLVSTSEVSVSLTTDPMGDETLAAILRDMKPIATVRVDRDRAIVCVVGEGMKRTRGVAGRIFSTMGSNGVNIEMISQGSSELNVSFVVRDEDAEKAVRALHEKFLAA